jgi:hypothetical protein
MAIFNSYLSLPEGILHISTLKRRRSHVSRFTFPFWRKKRGKRSDFVRRPATFGRGFLPPTIISRPSLTSPAMTEELFGPLLMVTPVKSLEETWTLNVVR